MKLCAASAAWLLCLCVVLRGTTDAPFQAGFTMGSQNTILWRGSPAARQPWRSAAVLASEDIPFGFAAGAVSYYASRDKLSDIVEGVGGIWYTHRGISLKVAYSQLDALRQYFRLRGYVSVGVPLYIFPGVRIGAELEHTLCGLHNSDAHQTFTTTGMTACMHKKSVNITAAISHILIQQAADESFHPPLQASLAISTTRHRFGAQGIGLDYVKDTQPRFRFRLGHSFWIHPSFATSFSLVTNPIMVGVGIQLQCSFLEAGAAYVFHPILGWSRGVHLMYPHQRRRR
jgi:hypothetical protein